MSQDWVDSAVVGNPEEFPCYSISHESATCAGKKIGWKPFTIRGVIRNDRQLRKWSMQAFTIKNTVIVFAVFIVEADCFNGKPTTTLGTSMQNGFLCVSTY